MGNSNLQEVANITEKEMYVMVSELETEGSWKIHISEYYPNLYASKLYHPGLFFLILIEVLLYKTLVLI